MSPRPALEELRESIGCLEKTQRRFSRIVSIADEVDCRMPFGGLPRGCIHEVKGTSVSSAVAFSAILSARIAECHGNVIYIAPGQPLYPLGLLPYGMQLDRLLMVSVRRPKDLPWAVLEALRCSQVSVVITLISGINLTDSRRLQLAAENSGATGFLLNHASTAPVAAPITRWMISPRSGQSQRFDEPAWKLDLLYCRGGLPANWTLEWSNRRLRALSTPALHKPGLFQTGIARTAREALAG